MLKMDIPKIEYLPSFIDGLKNGYRLDNLDPKNSEDILALEQNPEVFLEQFITQKTTPILSASAPDAPPVLRSEFWYVNDYSFIGRVNIRHALNNELLNKVGTIGFEVVPNEQQKGHATAMLQWGLEFCRNKTALEKALLITADSNIPSINLIEKNGGVLENTVQRPDSTVARRYWIML